MEVDALYWDIVTYLTDTLCIYIEGYFCYRFVKPFLAECKRDYYIWITYVIVNSLVFLVPGDVPGSIASAVLSAAIFTVMYFMDKRNVEQKIFLAVVCYLLEWVSWGMVVSMWNAAFYISLLIPVVQSDFRMQFLVYVIMEILWIVTFFFIMKLLVNLFHKTYIYKKENMTKRELVLMLAPLFSLIAGRWEFKFFTNVYEMDLKQYVWDNHHSYNLLLLFHQLISIASMFTVITIYQSIKGAQRREKEETVLARQIDDMEKHIGEVENLYYDIRSLKHDMINHVMVLEKLCRENEEAEKYVTQLKAQIEESALSECVKSGNPITDIIISEKQKTAVERGIDFQYEFHYPENTKLNAFDVSVILNNTINNAIEAAVECENPFVKILSYRKNSAYMIEIRNSIMGQRVIDSYSALPVTTKSGEGHGFGLANVKKVAQKYYGDIDIEQNVSEFILVVMLMVE